MRTAIQSRCFRHTRKGMTIIELTVILLVVLSLISVLFVAAQGWKRSSDRAGCLLNINTVQKAVRSYSSMYGYAPGSTVPSLQDKIIGSNAFIVSIPKCPAGGTCSCGEHHGPNVIPPIGELYLSCSLGETADHLPPQTAEW